MRLVCVLITFENDMGRTDIPTDGTTDTTSYTYRDVTAHLKRKISLRLSLCSLLPSQNLHTPLPFLSLSSVVIRGKINSALSLPLDEIPHNDSLAALLAIPHLNFFHVQRIVDLLAPTVPIRAGSF